MSVYVKALLVAAVLAVVTGVVVFKPMGLADLDFASPVIAGALAGAAALIGIGVGLALRASPSASSAPSTSTLSDDSADRDDARGDRLDARRASGARDEDALSALASELLGATSVDRVQAVLARQLPTLLGTPRLWIAGHVRGRRQVIVPDRSDGRRRDALLEADGHAWTTFTLRHDGDVVGVLGVETAAVTPAVRRRVHLAAPLIAQAFITAFTVDALREASLVDLLTGAATRREGLSRLRGEIKRAQRVGSTMAILMLDLDRFKSINDRFGHGVGDAVLSAVGQTMARTLRASDVRCRWGGEEFLIILPDTDLARAQVVAHGLLRNIAATSVPGPQGPVSSTASIGITVTRPGETDIEAIVRRADMALYRAKEAGRGCIRVVLGDRDGNPIGGGTGSGEPGGGAVPFPDRRDPRRTDRRRVPGPGRRRTDPRVPTLLTVASTTDRAPTCPGA